MEQTFFEKKLKPILLYMGTIVSVVMAIAYIIVVFVLIEGFQAGALLNTSIFSVITAAIGFCIMQMLKIQGQEFAKNLPQNQQVLDKYKMRNNNGIERKYKSMKHYWIASMITDLVVKCLTLALTSIGMIYIMIEGSGDYSLLLLAAVNLLMFAGFGLISLCKAYDFYNEEYVPYMIHEIEKATNKKFEETIIQQNNNINKCNTLEDETSDVIEEVMSEKCQEIQSESQGESKSDYVYDKQQ